MKEFYETYKVYLTRKNLEIAALVVIILSALLVFHSGKPRAQLGWAVRTRS